MSLPGLPCGHYTHSRQLGTNKGSTQSLLLQRQNSPERYATTTRSYGSCFGTINFRKAVSCASPQLSTTANDGSEHEPTRIFNDGGLASGIYTRLPRELRNRIYAFCAQGSYDNEVIIRRSPRRTHPFAFFVRECNGHHSYQWVEDPMVAFLSSRELGKDIAREMLESYYWTRTFKFAYRDLALLETFLLYDQMGVGITPASYARHLHLQIQPFPCAMLGVPETGMFEEEKCCRAIEALTVVQTVGTKVVIEIELAQGSMNDIVLERMREDGALPQVLRTVNRVREMGLRIETIISGISDEGMGCQMRVESACSLRDYAANIRSALKQTHPGGVI
jgi:hypothetical protein